MLKTMINMNYAAECLNAQRRHTSVNEWRRTGNTSVIKGAGSSLTANGATAHSRLLQTLNLYRETQLLPVYLSRKDSFRQQTPLRKSFFTLVAPREKKLTSAREHSATSLFRLPQLWTLLHE